MIRVNLCPIDELESQYWFVPDVACLVVVLAASFFGAQYYLGTIEDQIDEVNVQVQSLNENTAKLTPELEHIKNLERDEAELNNKLNALKSVTVSKISKYKPVIVLEHLQNLKPEGTWFESLSIGKTEDNDFEITGQALDNILTAELMTAIRSTGSQELDEADLRTQVYFSDLALDDTHMKSGGGGGAGGAPAARGAGGGRFGELARFPEFTIHGKIAERTPASTTAPASAEPLKSKKKGKPVGEAPDVSEAEPDRPASATTRF